MLKKQDTSNETFMGFVAPDLPKELEPPPQHFEEGVTVTTEHLLEVNLGDANQKNTFYGDIRITILVSDNFL